MQVETLLRTSEIDTGAGFEVLVEADGHSRTDLGAASSEAMRSATATRRRPSPEAPPKAQPRSR